MVRRDITCAGDSCVRSTGRKKKKIRIKRNGIRTNGANLSAEKPHTNRPTG